MGKDERTAAQRISGDSIRGYTDIIVLYLIRNEPDLRIFDLETNPIEKRGKIRYKGNDPVQRVRPARKKRIHRIVRRNDQRRRTPNLLSDYGSRKRILPDKM